MGNFLRIYGFWPATRYVDMGWRIDHRRYGNVYIVSCTLYGIHNARDEDILYNVYPVHDLYIVDPVQIVYNVDIASIVYNVFIVYEVSNVMYTMYTMHVV